MCEISNKITYHYIKDPDDVKTHSINWCSKMKCCKTAVSIFFLSHTDIAKILNTEPEFFHPYHQASCLSRGSQPRCYQTTSCLLLFSSSLTAFEVLKQLLIGAILYAGQRPMLRQRGGGWRLWLLLIPLITLNDSMGGGICVFKSGIKSERVSVCYLEVSEHLKWVCTFFFFKLDYSIKKGNAPPSITCSD